VLAGDALTWRFTVSNTGDAALSHITVTDSVSGVTPTYVSGDTNSDGKLDLGESWIYQATGSAALAVNGRVNEEGVFVGVNATDRVAGALTRNGKEAGYLFSKDVSAGTFRGITLWGRK
jgi:uncharacterized repeat protein (TIGR01451 family)